MPVKSEEYRTKAAECAAANAGMKPWGGGPQTRTSD